MTEVLKLSPQAIGALMLAVQKGAMAVMYGKSKEECDVTATLLDFDLENTADGLIVRNPPTISFGEDEDEDIDVEVTDIVETQEGE